MQANTAITSFGVVLKSQNESSQNTVINGLYCLLLLDIAEELHSVIHLQHLKHLFLLLLVSRFLKEYSELL